VRDVNTLRKRDSTAEAMRSTCTRMALTKATCVMFITGKQKPWHRQSITSAHDAANAQKTFTLAHHHRINT